MTTLTTSPSEGKDSESYRLAEVLLAPKYLLSDTFALALSMYPSTKYAAEDHKRKKDADRVQLLALPIEELRNRVAQQKATEAADRIAQAERDKRREQEKAAREAQAAAEREAKKFYNLPSSAADFEHWAAMDYWTFDEALALLMGMDPRVMTKKAMQKEIEPEFNLAYLSQPVPPKSDFVRRYEALRAIADRAAAMKPAQLRPIAVVMWAGDSGAIKPPDALVQALVARAKRIQHPMPSQPGQPTPGNVEPSAGLVGSPPQNTAASGDNEASSSASDVTSASEETPARDERTPWTKEDLDSLHDFHTQNGTAKSAAHFGISDTRVRQLLRKRKQSAEPLPAPTGGVFRHLLK